MGNRFDSLINISMSLLPDLKDACGSRHFSFILRNSKVLAVGVNRPFKTHPLAKLNNYRFESIHSEIDSVIKVRHKVDLSKCTMVNIRLSSDSIKAKRPILRASKPCFRCHDILLSLGFRKVFYTTNEGFEKL